MRLCFLKKTIIVISFLVLAPTFSCYAANINSSYASLSVTILPGSLQNNVTRVARMHGWSKIIWKPQQDYNWVGRTVITGGSLQEIFTQLLNNYPLQAVFYSGNHVLVIQPRTLQ